MAHTSDRGEAAHPPNDEASEERLQRRVANRRRIAGQLLADAEKHEADAASLRTQAANLEASARRLLAGGHR